MRGWWLAGVWAASGCVEIEGSKDPSPVTEATAGWPEAWRALEDEVLEQVNQERFVGANCGGEAMPGGLPPLEADEVLRATARLHSQDMAKRTFFEHINPDGDDPFDRMAAAGFEGAQPWGENIAYGTPDPEVVVELWMESPGHCMNIMLPEYRVLGVGYFADEESTGLFYWTQNFAAGH